MLPDIFKDALDEFFASEAQNILSGVSERNLCARLAMQLERIANEKGLHGYYADTEYNRKQNGKVKTMMDDDMQVISITCDLILHSRGEIIEKDNLIAIEMKKSERPEEEKVSDRSRLRTLTKASFDDIWSYDGQTHPEHVCGYDLGYFVELNKNNSSYTVQEFKNGNLCRQFNGQFGL